MIKPNANAVADNRILKALNRGIVIDQSHGIRLPKRPLRRQCLGRYHMAKDTTSPREVKY